jgi:hypothetical protein
MKHPVMTFRILNTSVAAALLLAVGTPAFAASAPVTQPKVQSTPAATTPANAASTEDIRDIRPPIHLPPSWLWMAWTAGAIALAGIGYALWRWRHQLPGLRPKLPFEVALERLEAARELMRPAQAREFSIAVSEIVRSYIELRFATRAAHHTTQEFLHDCVAGLDSPLAEHREALGNFLYHCDLAKFARWVLSIEEMEAMLQSACAFVRETGQTTPTQSQSPAHLVRGCNLPHTYTCGVSRTDAPASNSNGPESSIPAQLTSTSTTNTNLP